MTVRQVLLWAGAAALTALGAWYAVHGWFNFGILLVWLMAGAAVCYALFGRWLDVFFAHGAGRVLRFLFFAGCAFALTVLAVILCGQTASPTGREKAMLVLGCAVHGETPSGVLVERLQTALDYYSAHPQLQIVVCGGQGSGEDISEGEAMRRWLLARGVPDAQILCENKSTSTEENFRFARTLLAEKGIETDDALLYVTNGFHCYRAGLYAENEGYTNITALAAGLPATQILPCYLREIFALVYYWVFKSPNAGFLRRYVGVLSIFGRR